MGGVKAVLRIAYNNKNVLMLVEKGLVSRMFEISTIVLNTTKTLDVLNLDKRESRFRTLKIVQKPNFLKKVRISAKFGHSGFGHSLFVVKLPFSFKQGVNLNKIQHE